MRSKILAPLLCLLLIASSAQVAWGAEKELYAFRSTYVFENRGDEPYALTEEDATWVVFPCDDWQMVTIRNASHGIAREDTDEDGNVIAIMDFPSEISAGGRLIFSIDYLVESADRPRPDVDPGEAGLLSDIPNILLENLTSETETFTRNEEILSLARRLAEEQTTVLGVVARFIDWITANVTYDNWELPRYPDETLRDRLGDCDDQAILLVSMLRAVGVPAILQIGVVFSDSISSEKASWGGHLAIRQQGVGWHGWAMVYIPPWGWLPVDLTLTASREPLEAIQQAPQYESFVVTAFNVSKQEYVGGSRRSRELLMSSDVYITLTDVVIAYSEGDTGWLMVLYVGMGILAGGSFVAFIIVLNRRRRLLEGSNVISR